MLNLLVASLLLQLPVMEFDRMSLALPGTVSAPQVVGKVKVWEGKKANERGFVSAKWSVAITDISEMKPAPTDEMLITGHERRARTNPMLAGANLRKVIAKIESRKFVIMTGSVLVQQDGVIEPSMYMSFGFINGGKVYEFSEISSNLDEEQMQKTLESIAFENRKASGIPKDLSGEYTIAGVPFVVKSGALMWPLPPSAPTPEFQNVYEALGGDSGLNRVYIAAQLKPDDKRSDSALLYALAKRHLDGLKETTLSVSAGSLAKEFDVTHKGDKRHAYVRFERAGDWVGITLSSHHPDDTADLADQLKKFEITKVR